MNNASPLVSVIIPVKNSALFIEEALQSVAVSAKGILHEIIIINDGSTDGTEKILQKHRDHIRYFFQKSRGAASARNTGLLHAKGSYIAFIDADDVWAPSHCTALLSQFAEHPSCDIAMGYSQRFFSTDAHIKAKLPLAMHDTDGRAVFMPSFGCALFRSDIFQTIGPINDRYHWHEDVDWYLRALEQGTDIRITKEIVKYYRLHGANTTKALRPNDRTLLHVLAKSLKRRGNKKLPALGKTAP